MNKIEFNLKGKSGVYMFFNIESGKRYVGSSVDIYNRIHEHYHNLKIISHIMLIFNLLGINMEKMLLFIVFWNIVILKIGFQENNII